MGTVGFVCGLVAGMIVVLNNPFGSPNSGVTNGPQTYQWSALEFFGSSITPGEALRLPQKSPYVDLGAAEVDMTSAAVILLKDYSGRTVALGTRLSAIDKSSKLTDTELGVTTYTNIFWPNSGSVFLVGRENRWPILTNNAMASLVGDPATIPEFPVSAASSGDLETGVVGGSGQFRSAGGQYVETLWEDGQSPGLYAGAIELELTAVR